MRTWKGWLFGIAALALVIAALPTRADEANKLTILSFSAPVDLPGVSLPAGKYRFEIADPVESRKVIKVSNEDGSKQIAMLLTIPNQMTKTADDPVVMFTETTPGSPHAIKAWFYPGESIGYEFVYPHDQAAKIARANHADVLASDKDRVGRVNESGQFSQSSNPTFANSGAVTTVDSSSRSARAETSSQAERRAQPATPATTTANARPDAAASQSAAAQPDTSANANVNRSQSRARADQSSPAVGTSGQSANANRRELPRTASPLPWVGLFSGLSLAGALVVRRWREAIA